jgi:methyl-accepting chemotaxis protein
MTHAVRSDGSPWFSPQGAVVIDMASDGLHARVFAAARAAADAIGALFSAALKDGALNRADLFDQHYQPIPNTDPPKYHTRYDAFADRVLPPIQEAVLTAHPALTFAIACDTQGYVPTHNQRFAKPLTGDPARDLIGNRTKRLFNDPTGARCGSHTQWLLLQTYKRDTGEILHDLSVPIWVAGQHWGGFRIGYPDRLRDAWAACHCRRIDAEPTAN